MKKLINITDKTIAGTLWEQDGFLFLICTYINTRKEIEYYSVELRTSKIDDMFFQFYAVEDYVRQQSMTFIGHINDLDIDSYLEEKAIQ